MNTKYYSVADDVKAYPAAWCIVAVGGRKKGKTYGALRDCYENNRKFVFVKRTNDDVKLLCAGSGRVGVKTNEYAIDISPFKPLNRDYGWNVHIFEIDKGLAGFWKCEIDDDGAQRPVGEAIGYVISLNAVSKYSGFDMSDAEWLIFDEFIPRAWERVLRTEGDQLMDLYMTIARDREERGRPPLKMILLANAVSISPPAAAMLEITDTIADASISGKEYVYIEERGILIHLIRTAEEYKEEEKKSVVYKAMGDTAWGRMAYENDFAYNDFSNVGKMQLKGFRPVCGYKYKKDSVFVYQRDGKYYLCKSKANLQPDKTYDLNLENEQKRFYYDYALDLRNECINGNVRFESYTMYDLITNYHRIFQLR